MNRKKGLLKKILIGFGAVAVLGGIIYASAYMGSKGDVPFVDGSSVTGETSNALANIPSLNSNQSNTFTGDPVPVKWPSDIQPTRMEVFLNPINGDPVLLLVGDKSGLGTVLRSYDKQGSLNGYWVIVPDNATATTNTQQTTTNNTVPTPTATPAQ
ncbi:hypothetical protein D3C80_1631840 [compost metagenome]